MDKKTGLILTVAAAILCGGPGLISLFVGAIMVVSSQMSENMAKQNPRDAILLTYLFGCFGLLLIAIPVVVGFLTLQNGSKAQNNNTPIPPAT